MNSLLVTGCLKFKAAYPQADNGKELDSAIVFWLEEKALRSVFYNFLTLTHELQKLHLIHSRALCVGRILFQGRKTL
jgi:hypothetical protein